MENLRWRGFSIAKNFKRKYEAKLEIPGGVGEGSNPKSILGGGMDISWNHTKSVVTDNPALTNKCQINQSSQMKVAYNLYDSRKYFHIYNFTSREMEIWGAGCTCFFISASKGRLCPCFF